MIIRSLLRGAAALALALLGAATPAAQSQPPAPSPEPTLTPVLVTAPPPLSSSSEQLIRGKDFELRPQGRPADVLRLIAGLNLTNTHWREAQYAALVPRRPRRPLLARRGSVL